MGRPKLTVGECARILKRVMLFFPMEKDTAKLYIETIWHQASEVLDGPQLERVCQVLCGRMQPYKAPVWQEYKVIVDELYPPARPATAQEIQATKCQRCLGRGAVHLGRQTTVSFGGQDFRVPAAEPCPDCQGTGRKAS